MPLSRYDCITTNFDSSFMRCLQTNNEYGIKIILDNNLLDTSSLIEIVKEFQIIDEIKSESIAKILLKYKDIFDSDIISNIFCKYVTKKWSPKVIRKLIKNNVFIDIKDMSEIIICLPDDIYLEYIDNFLQYTTCDTVCCHILKTITMDRIKIYCDNCEFEQYEYVKFYATVIVSNLNIMQINYDDLCKYLISKFEINEKLLYILLLESGIWDSKYGEHIIDYLIHNMNFQLTHPQLLLLYYNVREKWIEKYISPKQNFRLDYTKWVEEYNKNNLRYASRYDNIYKYFNKNKYSDIPSVFNSPLEDIYNYIDKWIDIFYKIIFETPLIEKDYYVLDIDVNVIDYIPKDKYEIFIDTNCRRLNDPLLECIYDVRLKFNIGINIQKSVNTIKDSFCMCLHACDIYLIQYFIYKNIIGLSFIDDILQKEENILIIYSRAVADFFYDYCDKLSKKVMNNLFVLYVNHRWSKYIIRELIEKYVDLSTLSLRSIVLLPDSLFYDYLLILPIVFNFDTIIFFIKNICSVNKIIFLCEYYDMTNDNIIKAIYECIMCNNLNIYNHLVDYVLHLPTTMYHLLIVTCITYIDFISHAIKIKGDNIITDITLCLDKISITHYVLLYIRIFYKNKNNFVQANWFLYYTGLVNIDVKTWILAYKYLYPKYYYKYISIIISNINIDDSNKTLKLINICDKMILQLPLSYFEKT